MDEDSPFFIFDPTSRGSLIYKFGNELPITKEDIDLVLTQDDQAHHDPRMLPILIASHQGKFTEKLGRPNHKDSFLYKGRIFWADEDMRKRADKIRKKRKDLTAIEKRALVDPMEQAADEIAAEYNFRISGRSLRNEISSQKSNLLFGDGKKRGK